MRNSFLLFPRGPSKEIFAFQSPAISALPLVRYWVGSRFLRRATAVHHHAGHVHVDRKIHIANIDKLAVAIAELDEDVIRRQIT